MKKLNWAKLALLEMGSFAFGMLIGTMLATLVNRTGMVIFTAIVVPCVAIVLIVDDELGLTKKKKTRSDK